LTAVLPQRLTMFPLQSLTTLQADVDVCFTYLRV